MNGWVTEISRHKFVKECLQQRIVRANKAHWRLVTRKRITKKAQKRSNPPSQNCMVLLLVILEEDHQSSDKEKEYDTTDRDYVPTDPSYNGDTSVNRSCMSRCSQHADDFSYQKRKRSIMRKMYI